LLSLIVKEKTLSVFTQFKRGGGGHVVLTRKNAGKKKRVDIRSNGEKRADVICSIIEKKNLSYPPVSWRGGEATTPAPDNKGKKKGEPRRCASNRVKERREFGGKTHLHHCLKKEEKRS